MSFHYLSPILYTNQLAETIEFYTKELGFMLEAYNADYEWATVKKDHVEIMFSKPNAHIPFDKAHFTGSFYIRVNDVDEIWNHLKERTTIVYSLDNFDYGMREFAIYDNNGYILQFGEPLNDA
ncbi:MAG: VOC family protein [Agriterribacter sp.]